MNHIFRICRSSQIQVALSFVVALGLNIASSADCQATILPFTGATFSEALSGGAVVTQPTNLTSYTTTSGTVTDLSHAISGQGQFDAGGTGVRNVWLDGGFEIEGVAASLNFDVSTGVLNAGDTDDTSVVQSGGIADRVDFFYSQDITAGVAGDANDFYLIDVAGGETMTVVPLDATGTAIGDFSLSLNAGDAHWGEIATITVVGGNVASFPTTVDGVAFDFEDFTGTGTLTGFRGIGISGTAGFDAMVVGVNSNLASSVAPLFTAVVQPITGEIQLVNLTPDPIDFDSYQLQSETVDTLNPAGWNSLSDQNLDPFDDGADLGETWDEAGASATAMAEQFLLGSTTLAPGEAVTLGTIYDTSAGGEFTFLYRDDASEEIIEGDVAIVLLGDMDGNGTLEEADINPFVQALTNRADYLSSNPGLVSADMVGDFNGNGRLDLGDISGFKSAIAALGTASATANAVPEPSTAALLLLSCMAMTLGRSRQRKM